MKTTRRHFLQSATAALAISPFLNSRLLANDAGARKKILFFTKSQTFQHSAIARPTPDKLSLAEQTLTDLGAKNNFDVTCSKDGSIFTPDNIASFDAFAFYTTGDLTKPSDPRATKKGPGSHPVPDPARAEPPMPPGGKEAFLDAIKAGKGFVGFHSAADTLHSPKHVRGQVNLLRDLDDQGHDQFDPYIQMLGGEFIIHGQQQKALLKCIDPNFPGAKAFDNAQITEEWYSLKNFAPDLHVILAQDCSAMHGPMYQRGTYPETWARMHGAGRVFYTSMGHREDIWKKPEYLALILGALNWITKRIDVDIPANIQQATPDANPQSNPKA
ncbi:MAG TPA: ThuA domain-containing protein [Tepidisphaeraceae bacterium]|jgi:hypothetical protein|nr:ThuA domain-containing protein [Tepidisphaeraceae bacterium]